jgi:hypothetical protein
LKSPGHEGRSGDWRSRPGGRDIPVFPYSILLRANGVCNLARDTWRSGFLGQDKGGPEHPPGGAGSSQWHFGARESERHDQSANLPVRAVWRCDDPIWRPQKRGFGPSRLVQSAMRACWRCGALNSCAEIEVVLRARRRQGAEVAFFVEKTQNPLLACILECGFWAGAGKNAGLGPGRMRRCVVRTLRLGSVFGGGI